MAPPLRLPYYWDEAGYYIPAAYDFFRTGSLIPFSTLSNAHPPLPSIYLAALWKLFGSLLLMTRVGMCCIAAVSPTVAAATDSLPVVTTASRQVAVSATAAIQHMPTRVISGEKPKSFQSAARYIDGSGG